MNGRTILAPTEEQVRRLTIAFDALPVSLQGTVSVLMVANWDSDVNAGGQTVGFRIMFKRDVLDGDQQDVISARTHHEAVHAYTNILDSRSGADSTLASSFLSSARTELPVIGGFHETWCELQNVAISAGLSKPYGGTRGDAADLCQHNGSRVSNESKTRALDSSGW